MNELAAQPDAILASANFMIDHKLKVGDRVRINVRQTQIDFVIVDWVDYFPTQFPDTDYFAIANLDYIFDNIKFGPYDVWAKTETGRRHRGDRRQAAQAGNSSWCARRIPERR